MKTFIAFSREKINGLSPKREARTGPRFALRAQIVLCAVVLWMGYARPARADHIDKEFFKQGLQIMNHLKAQGYKNVGVLKFLVKKGNNPPTFTAGKLNYVMATRLENVLIMKQDQPENLIGITRGASAVAVSKDKNATYLTLEGREKLFKHKYPLAWGDDNVQVDCFLTGLVEIAPDMKKSRITIQAFDRKNSKLRDVLTFEVSTDLAILRDTNQDFVVARRTFNAWATADDPEEKLAEIAIENAVKQNQPSAARRLTLDEAQEFVKIEILYNNTPMAITPEGFVDEPAAGQDVAFRLTTKIKLGLLLRVNGVNTLNAQREERAQLNEYDWWVLEPNKVYTIKGSYQDGKLEPFKARAAEEVDILTDLGENAERHGKFDFDLFVDPAHIVADANPKVRKGEFSFRTASARAATFEDLRKLVQFSMYKNAMRRNFVVPDPQARQDAPLESAEFDGRHVGGLTLHYRRDKSK